MQKLLSIVIPVYKVEDYIRKCIESLIVPDKKQLELLDIVIINDGTPDNSAVIAKEYEAKYPSIIRVIDQENRGHGGAWNHGTELAVVSTSFTLIPMTGSTPKNYPNSSTTLKRSMSTWS